MRLTGAHGWAIIPGRVARCFVTRKLPGAALGRLARAHEVEVWPERLPPTREQLFARVTDVDGLLCMLTDEIDATLLDHAPLLTVISNYAVGYDNVDVAAATARGIRVGNTPDVLTDATADLTFALLLAITRNLPQEFAAVREGRWLPWEPGHNLGADVYGQTLGLIGFGRIGKAVAKRASGFDMRVLHSDSRSDQTAINELLATSDFVSLHTPLTPQTHHLIDAAALARMKPSAFLINTARGGIVDQVALAEALHNHAIAGAALDVTDPEPLAAADPLLKALNVIVVPHIGSATTRTRERMADLAVENLMAGLDGKPLPHQVRLP
jgi:glyoxylate reductase